jgi:hypothetical protein
MTGRSIIIHSLEDARTALQAAAELATEVALHSGPGAAGYGGVAWFERLVAAALAEFPAARASAVLDCGEAPGHVLAAIRWAGQPGRIGLVLRFTGDEETAGRLADMAGQAGLQLVRDSAPGLDLRGARDPLAACRDWLASKTAPAV